MKVSNLIPLMVVGLVEGGAQQAARSGVPRLGSNSPRAASLLVRSLKHTHRTFRL